MRFEIDEATGRVLDQLSVVYGTVGREATLRRAVAIASVLTENADENGVIRLLEPGGAPIEIHARTKANGSYEI